MIPNKHDDKTEEYRNKEKELLVVLKAIQDYQTQEKALSVELQTFIEKEKDAEEQIAKLQNSLNSLNELIKKKEFENQKIIEEAETVFYKQISLLLIKRVISSHL